MLNSVRRTGDYTETFVASSRQLAANPNGEMSEWLKEHAWKACVGETLPWVRIPLSPPNSKFEGLCAGARHGTKIPSTRRPTTSLCSLASRSWWRQVAPLRDRRRLHRPWESSTGRTAWLGRDA